MCSNQIELESYEGPRGLHFVRVHPKSHFVQFSTDFVRHFALVANVVGFETCVCFVLPG